MDVDYIAQPDIIVDDVGVDLCDGDVLVAQGILDYPKVYPAAQELGRAGVTEHVGVSLYFAVLFAKRHLTSLTLLPSTKSYRGARRSSSRT